MVNLSSSVRTVHAGVPTNVWREPADSLFFGKGRLSRLVVPSSGIVKVMIFFGLASLFFGGEEPTRNQWLIQLDNSTSIVRRLQYSSLLLMLRCGVIRCLKCAAISGAARGAGTDRHGHRTAGKPRASSFSFNFKNKFIRGSVITAELGHTQKRRAGYS